jgi:hypothetical protein
MSDVLLTELFDYTDTDLTENRAGRLSERQQQRLHAQARHPLSIAGTCTSP